MKLDKSPENIHNMFNLISERYDFMNNVISFGLHNYVKFSSVNNLDIQPHYKVLDLCTGTGDLAQYMKKIQPLSDIIGVDFSEKMLQTAKQKSIGIQYIQADVTRLPFADNTFDIVTIGFGLRNISNSEKAVEEAYRVTKPGGLFLHLDFGIHNIFSKIFNLVTLLVVNIFSKNPMPYKYLIQSKKDFPLPNDLIKDFESKGFAIKTRRDYLLGVISCQILRKPTRQ